MEIEGINAVVTGGASGLGLATATALVNAGATVTITDLESSEGAARAEEIGADFVAGDVTSEDDITKVMEEAHARGPIRACIHCAGRGGPVRVVEKDGTPGSLEAYKGTIETNLVGSFNVLRLAAAKMVTNEVLDGDRGVVVMTASVAAFEGQIGQIPYSASKAGIVGMTIVAARDLARKAVRVNTIAPGIFDTPLLARLPEEVKESLGKTVPHPPRLGQPEEYAKLALHMIDNGVLNGETIRLDGAIRMTPR